MKSKYLAKLEGGIVVKAIKGESLDIPQCQNGTWVQGENRPAVGYTYDPDLDAFIAPQPYPSWILNRETYSWEPPEPFPSSDPLDPYMWVEEETAWVFVAPPTPTTTPAPT